MTPNPSAGKIECRIEHRIGSQVCTREPPSPAVGWLLVVVVRTASEAVATVAGEPPGIGGREGGRSVLFVQRGQPQLDLCARAYNRPAGQRQREQAIGGHLSRRELD